MNDTIIAAATPIGESALGLIRLSGREARHYAIKLIQFQRGGHIKNHTVKLGKLYSPDGSLIDEVLAAFYKGPHSYTGEDLIEISCHGSPFIIQEVLQAFQKIGARPARPGEFTQRAYLNGRMDLTQAEAVNDIIRSHTQYSKAAALNQLEGKFNKEIEKIHSGIMDLLAELEAAIDHSDLEEVFLSYEEIDKKINIIIKETESLLKTAPAGKMAHSGIQAAVIGAPNTGKSSMMNCLLRDDRVIVSDIPGTTRDIVQEELNIRGISVRIADTAGIRKSKDILEKKGIERSLKKIEQSDLRIVMLDSSRSINEEDKKIMNSVAHLKNIYILNKIDLKQITKADDIKKIFNVDVIPVSALKNKGLDSVEKAIYDFYFSFGYDPEKDIMITNIRQESLLRETQKYLKKSLMTLKDGLPEEFIASGIRQAKIPVEEITGKTTDEDLLGKIFSQFCVGK